MFSIGFKLKCSVFTRLTDMILGSKEWTNDYGVCLSDDDNDLKTKQA